MKLNTTCYRYYKQIFGWKLFLGTYLFGFVITASAQNSSLKQYQIGDSLFALAQYDTALSIFNKILANPISDSLKAKIFFQKGVILFLNNDLTLV